MITQRTEILAGTLAENIALFADVPRDDVEPAVDELGLTAWVAGLPEGLDTTLGPGGTTLSAGEEQLVAFARLLVRDVRVVVLDEATARMDPLTEARVVARPTGCWPAAPASSSPTGSRPPSAPSRSRCSSAGASSSRADGSSWPTAPGPSATSSRPRGPPATGLPADVVTTDDGDVTAVGTARRTGTPPPSPALRPLPTLTRATAAPCSSTRAGAWPAWACSWSPPWPGRSGRDRLDLGPHRRLAERRRHAGRA